MGYDGVIKNTRLKFQGNLTINLLEQSIAIFCNITINFPQGLNSTSSARVGIKARGDVGHVLVLFIFIKSDKIDNLLLLEKRSTEQEITKGLDMVF